MADLGDQLKRAAPSAPEFDPDALARRRARKKQRRVAIAATAIVVVIVAVALPIAIEASRHETTTLVVTPTPTPSLPTTTLAPTTTTELHALRSMTDPVQTSPIPAEAFIAVGPSVIAVDTHDPTVRRTLTTFPDDSSITWITADVAHQRVFVGVTSGCDPGVNGMYEVLLNGGARTKIAPSGNRALVSPAGRMIAYSRNTDGCGSRDLVIRDLVSGQQWVFTADHSIGVGGWSADGESVFLNAYDIKGPTISRFRPFDATAKIDDAELWDYARAADSGGGRVAIIDWCSGDESGNCLVGVRTRVDWASISDAEPDDYDFGRETHTTELSIDETGQWPLIVEGMDASNPVVSYFANGQWHKLGEANAADW